MLIHYSKIVKYQNRQMNFYRPDKIITQNRVVCFVVGAVLLTGFWFLAKQNYAKEVTITNEPVAIMPSVSHAPQFTLLSKIQEGIELLKKSLPLKYDKSKKEIALAILNKDTGEIFEQRVWVREDEIKNYKKTGVISLQPVVRSPTSNNTPDIKINWWNSFNTDYEITGHLEMAVIANKYPFPSKNLTGLPEKSKAQNTDIIYVPYSKQLHMPEIVEAGKSYLEKNTEQAFAELDTNKVKSRYTANTLVTAGISKDFVRNIILVEHIDPDVFNVSADGGKELAERVLAIIGANQNYAYRYTGSPAGASGLAQFIKSTYKNIASKYPEARLIKDYAAGMANHVNAIKAMVLFFDIHKKDIAGKTTRKDIAQSLGITEEMLAAAYNGGPGRITSSINKFGLAWISGQLRLPASAKVLRQETINYIKKFQAIKGLNIFQ